MSSIFSNLFGQAGGAQSFPVQDVAPMVAPGGTEQISIDPVGGGGMGGFAQLLSDPNVAQALLSAGGSLQSGQNLSQALAGGLQTYQNLLAKNQERELLKGKVARDEKRLGLEERRVATGEMDAETRRKAVARDKAADMAKAKTAAAKLKVEEKYKQAQIKELTAKTAKLEAEVGQTLTGTDASLWDKAMNTVLESTELGEKPTIKSVAALYNQLAPAGKKLELPFTSVDLKSALESSEGSQLSRDDQIRIVQDNYGKKAATKFAAALAKRDKMKANAPVQEEKSSLFGAMFGD